MWLTHGTIIAINFVSTGAKKLWNYRKEQLQAVQFQIHGNNIVPNGHQNQQPSNNNFMFNNAIHNKDVLNFKQTILVCIIAVGIVVGSYVSSLLINKTSKFHLGVRFFCNHHIIHLAQVILIPVIFFTFNKHARRHVKMTFWNEWAPEFIQVYNPNRVVGIELSNYSSVPIPSNSKSIASTSIAVLPGQTLTNESTQTTESITPEPNSNIAFDIVTSSYVPLPSTSKGLIGPGTSFLIPIVGPDFPLNDSTETNKTQQSY